jgi:hypothetical protein
VHIVDDQPDPVPEPAEIGEQPLDGRPAVQIGSRGQRPDQLRSGGRVPQCAEHRQPEPLRVALLALHRDPRDPLRQARRGDPGPQQQRLPAAGRRGYLGHPPRRAEPLEKPGSRDDSVRPHGAPPWQAPPLHYASPWSPADLDLRVTRHRILPPSGRVSPCGVTPAHPGGHEACCYPIQAKQNWSPP